MAVTIVLPISRPDYLRRVFAALDMMPCNAQETNLLCYVDGDQRLLDIARNFVVNSKFKEKVCIFRGKGLPSANHIRGRRQRIADIHNELKEIVGAVEFCLLMEDDTLIPLNGFEKLMRHYSSNPYAGFITGVQVGRWGYTVPGVWQSNNPYDIKRINSMLPNSEKPFEEIDAAGLYFCLTRTEFYKQINFQPFDSILGPDVTYGIELRKLGYKNYVDWTINTTHLTKQGEIKVYNTPLQKITFTRIEAEKWAQEVT